MKNIKVGLLAFWATYFSIVTPTNIVDGLNVLHLLDSKWLWSSGNFEYLQQVAAIYNPPVVVEGILFIIIVII